MSNGRYLIVSYFLFGLVSLGLGVAAYLVLQRPFAAIADAVAGRFRSPILKRALAVSMTLAAVLGFLSVSYTQSGCDTIGYEAVIKDRSYLVQVNQQQLQRSSEWIVYVVFAAGVVVLICLVVLRKREEGSGEA
ncbi:MAG: hypothetical protein ACLQBK_22555 [Candidatus Sulfotelmatobacter sp.]